MPLNEVIQHEWIIENANIKAIDENYEKINKSNTINHKDESNIWSGYYCYSIYFSFVMTLLSVISMEFSFSYFSYVYFN